MLVVAGLALPSLAGHLMLVVSPWCRVLALLIHRAGMYSSIPASRHSSFRTGGVAGRRRTAIIQGPGSSPILTLLPGPFLLQICHLAYVRFLQGCV